MTEMPERKRVPEAHVLAMALRTMRMIDVAKKYGVSPSAICVKLRRAGMPRGESIQKKPARDPVVAVISEPPKRADTVIRITHSGARVTMPRVTIIDGPAADRGNT